MKNLKNILLFFLLCAVAGSGADLGQTGNVYPLGAEGIDAALTPPPGFYLRWYTFEIHTTAMCDSKGNAVPMGFNVNVLATAPRLIWITKKKFLRADVGMDVLVPIEDINLKIAVEGFKQSSISMGDLYFDPVILSWHGKHYDAGVAPSFFAPTGTWDRQSATKAGSDEWTIMPTFGATWYPDSKKKWSASALGRYEFHATKEGEAVKMGDDFHVEYGLANAVRPLLKIGAVGYMQRKVTEDSGKDVTWDASVRDRVFASGIEVMKIFPRQMFFVQLRGLFEYGARGRSQDEALVLVLTKRFQPREGG